MQLRCCAPQLIVTDVAQTPMNHGVEQARSWRDEGLLPVALVLVSYVWLLFPVSMWSLIGVASMLCGALVTVALWHGARSRNSDPSPATKWAIRMLKIWPLWALVCGAVVGSLSN